MVKQAFIVFLFPALLLADADSNRRYQEKRREEQNREYYRQERRSYEQNRASQEEERRSFEENDQRLREQQREYEERLQQNS